MIASCAWSFLSGRSSIAPVPLQPSSKQTAHLQVVLWSLIQTSRTSSSRRCAVGFRTFASSACASPSVGMGLASSSRVIRRAGPAPSSATALAAATSSGCLQGGLRSALGRCPSSPRRSEQVVFRLKWWVANCLRFGSRDEHMGWCPALDDLPDEA
eukprot:4934014-Alexandrium_andersonii.AAC.1